MKKLFCLLMVVLLAFSTVGCGNNKNNDIVVLFTGDVLCSVDTNIGYAGLLSYKNAMKSKTPYVTLVDLGNAIQGDFVGTVSKGAYPIDMMNKVGYDFAVFGNHEFDYGLPRLSELINRSNAKYLACNIVYQGVNEENNPLINTKPYEIVKYGNKKVAFIGVTTPKSMNMSIPSNFKENDEIAYDFKGGTNANKLITVVQGFVNEVRNKGADYVIILSHLGDTADCSPFTSTALIKGTFDVDVVLDAHSGSEISSKILKNKNGLDVVLSSCGFGLANIGKLVISDSGLITTSLVSGYANRDSGFTAYYDELKTIYETEKNEIVAFCDTALKSTDDEGANIIKSRETPLGNFCADAYKTIAEADIALIPANSIGADLPIGDVKYSDVLKLQNFGGNLCKATVTGQEIIDALEIASMYTTAEYKVNGKAVGESDFFMQVSGIKFTINTSVKSSVKFDELGAFKCIDGVRRVQNVFVANSRGVYIPINPKAEYTLASTDTLIKEGIGGINIFTDNSLIIEGGIPDYQVLIDYLNEFFAGQLGGNYSAVEGRIIVK